MSRTSRRKRGPVRAKKVEYDGIKFASGLEKYMYVVLKEAKIKAKYEGQSYELVPSFSFNNKSYERQANSKGEYKDFIGQGFIIECKGRPNESFPIRWKLFKKYISTHHPDITLYKPQTKKECEETVSLILGKRKT